MASPFLGEIRLMSFNFPPKGWAFCNGQLLPINQNQALFALLGTMYGGNGVTTFALPDFQGRLPWHLSASYPQGTRAGEEAHTLISTEMPTHTHLAYASSNIADQASPAGNFWANGGTAAYAPTPDNTMAGQAIAAVGGNQAHENRQPFLVISFCIALQGIFPSRS